MQFTLVDIANDANPDAVIVTLFLCKLSQVRGWYVGPISKFREGIRVPYAAPSLQLLGMVALVQAQAIAKEMRVPVCVVDAEALWTKLVWGPFT